jgi:UV DNA damage endonuclease
MTKRIGFCCKFSELHPTRGVVTVPEFNCKTTTIAWLQRQTKQTAFDKLLDIAKHNITSIKNVVKHLSTLQPELRMFRISSDILPAYTHPDYQYFYRSNDIRNHLERWMAPIGETARKNDVRLSFHPDQFVVLASDRDEVVKKSIEEFEYHTDMARWMGYGKQFQDFKINVHISGRRGPQGIIDALSKLSPEARNCITIENDEISWGIESSLELKDYVALVLDIHHHYVMTGEYIQANDDRIKRIIDSWRGVRPVIHYSVSREEYLPTHSIKELPNHQFLLEQGLNKQKLRAHSDYMWNDAVNDWAYTHWQWGDIMVEAKAKNLASFQLHEYWKNKFLSNAIT